MRSALILRWRWLKWPGFIRYKFRRPELRPHKLRLHKLRPFKVAQGGFSLLELMVAVFIFALATAGFFQVLGQSARHAEYLETKYFAELLAHNDLVEISLLKRPPDIGLSNGKHIFAERTYYWFQAVNETENSTIRKVSLRIESESGQTLSELNLFVGINP